MTGVARRAVINVTDDLSGLTITTIAHEADAADTGVGSPSSSDKFDRNGLKQRT